MRYVQSLRLNFWHDTCGSAVVGFVAVAPVILITFLAIAQVALLGMSQVGLSSAVQQGARVASVLNGTDGQARAQVVAIAGQQGLILQESQVTIRHFVENGTFFASVSAKETQWISFLHRSVTLSATSRAVDERRYN